MQPTQNIYIKSLTPLIAPDELKAKLPCPERANRTVVEGREAVRNILSGKDHRMMVIVGPCSIHDRKAAMDYANRLHALAKTVGDRILVVMRVYFEKPRTTVGWKGLINDPHLNDTFDISAGLHQARELLLEINELGLPAATEVLEPVTPQYVADLVTVAAIGARTTESPTHRQMSSGLSMPVGFKNGTDGSLQVALDAMQAAKHPHAFLGIDGMGRTCIVNTAGNPWGFLILRGGRSGPNYSHDFLKDATDKLAAGKFVPSVVVDCSHANSDKDHRKQAIAWKDVVEQRAQGNKLITGLMLESNIGAGAQKLTTDLAKLQYGVSITDACIDWNETQELLLWAYNRLAQSEQTPAAAR